MSTDVNADGATEQPREVKRLYVSNLPFKATAPQIQEFFSDYTVVSVNIPKVKKTSSNGKPFFRKLGFAFVEFSTPEEAQAVVDKMEGATFLERQLSIKFAIKAPERKEKPKASSSEEDGAEESKEADTSKDTKAPSSKKTKPKPKEHKKRSVKTKDLPDSTDTIYVTGLPKNIKKPELEEFFQDITPLNIKIAASPPRRVFTKEGVVRVSPKTYAFIKLADEDAQKQAIEKYNEAQFLDHGVIPVQVAKQELDPEEAPVADEKEAPAAAAAEEEEEAPAAADEKEEEKESEDNKA